MRRIIFALLLLSSPAFAGNWGQPPQCLDIRVNGVASAIADIAAQDPATDPLHCAMFGRDCRGSTTLHNRPARIIHWTPRLYLVLSWIPFADGSLAAVPLVVDRTDAKCTDYHDSGLRYHAEMLGFGDPR